LLKNYFYNKNPSTRKGLIIMMLIIWVEGCIFQKKWLRVKI